MEFAVSGQSLCEDERKSRHSTCLAIKADLRLSADNVPTLYDPIHIAQPMLSGTDFLHIVVYGLVYIRHKGFDYCIQVSILCTVLFSLHISGVMTAFSFNALSSSINQKYFLKRTYLRKQYVVFSRNEYQ